MSKKNSTTAAASGGVDEDTSYAVELSASVKVGRQMIHPGSNPVVRGDVLSRLIAESPDAVKDYKPVA